MESARPFISSSLTLCDKLDQFVHLRQPALRVARRGDLPGDQEAIDEKVEQGATVTQSSRQFGSPSVETLALLGVAEKQVRAREPRQNQAALLVVVARRSSPPPP